MGRAPCCEKVGLRKGRWTAEEDEILAQYISTNGEGSWRSLPKNAGLLRCGKSCRLRWINYLRADLKRGNITKDEEDIIVKLHASFGNRWSLIAGHLPGRTDNEIKNYWNSHLSRRVDTFRRFTFAADGTDQQIPKLPTAGKRRGGRTSRSAMKKKNTITATTKDDTNNISDDHTIITSSALKRAQSDVSDLIQANSSTVTIEGPNEEMLSALWGSTEMMEEMLVINGATHEQERESGKREKVAEQRGEQEEEGGSGQMEMKAGLDWDLEEMEAKLWDDDEAAGETWPWIWDDGESTYLEGYGYQFEENQPLIMDINSWLVPDVM